MRSPRLTLVLEVTEPSERQFHGRFVRVHPGDTKVMAREFIDDTHARAVTQAVSVMVEACLTYDLAMRLVLPNRTVVNLLQGNKIVPGCPFSQMIADLRDKVDFQMVDVTFEHGRLRSILGEASKQVKVW